MKESAYVQQVILSSLQENKYRANIQQYIFYTLI
jgi:hypothetical protein